MKHNDIDNIGNAKILKYSGIGIETFENLAYFLNSKQIKKHERGGRPSKMSIEDMLLATLRYNNNQDNETYASIAIDYYIHESNMYENIKWVEKTLKEYGLIKKSEFYNLSINVEKLNKLI